MTTEGYEIVVSLVDGHARELSRTFTTGLIFPPLSLGSQGDWQVSAEGVASVHLWLRFDGQRLYAASAVAEAAAYLQDLRLDHTWHEVTDRSELRFGRARMTVFQRPAGMSSSVSPEVRVSPEARVSLPAGVEPRSLTPIERAAALPLPSFFTDRLRAGREPSPVALELQRARFSGPHTSPQSPTRAAILAARQRRPTPWLLLGIPALLLPFIFVFLWLIGSGHPSAVPVAAPAPSSTPVPPPESATARLEAPPLLLPPSLLPRPEPPAPEPIAALEPIALTPPAVLHAAADRQAPPQPGPTEPPPAYPQKVADKPVPRIGAEPWTISEEWLAHHERQLHAPNRARAKVIFLGDSITEGWAMAPAYHDSFAQYSPLNLGIVSDVTQNVLWRVDHGALDGTTPDVLVLMIGINNLAGGFSPRETVAGIQAILVAVQAHLPNARVLLLGILPARQSPDDPLRQRVLEANQLLASLPASSRVSFHDVGAVLLEPDGTVTKATLRDFIHPSAAGYARLSDAVAPLIGALMGASSGAAE